MMRLCTGCHRQEAPPGYQKCAACRAQNNRAQRAYYARHHQLYPAPTRARALRMLSMPILSPGELADAIGISCQHAGIVLRRLEQRGICRRFVAGRQWNGRPKLRYQLRDDAGGIHG